MMINAFPAYYYDQLELVTLMIVKRNTMSNSIPQKRKYEDTGLQQPMRSRFINIIK